MSIIIAVNTNSQILVEFSAQRMPQSTTAICQQTRTYISTQRNS